MSCGGCWINSSELIEIGDRWIVLLLKIPCGLLRLQRSPTYKISSEILLIPLEKAQNKQWEGCSLVCISGVSDIPSQRCQSHKTLKQPAWLTAALYLQANWRVLPWLSQGLELLSGEQFEPSSSPSQAASLTAHLAQKQEPPPGSSPW